MGKIIVEDIFYINGRGIYIIVDDPDNSIWLNNYYINDLKIEVKGYKNIDTISNTSYKKEVNIFCDIIDSLPVSEAKEFIKTLIGKEIIKESEYIKINRNRKIDDIIK